jgi:hypothetical protein
MKVLRRDSHLSTSPYRRRYPARQQRRRSKPRYNRE